MVVKIHAIIVDQRDLKLHIPLALPLLYEYINSFMINDNKKLVTRISLIISTNCFNGSEFVNSRPLSATFWGSCC